MSNIEKSDNHPKVGVVIPAYNEEEFIGLTLKHLLNHVLGGDFWDKLRALFIREARVEFSS